MALGLGLSNILDSDLAILVARLFRPTLRMGPTNAHYTKAMQSDRILCRIASI